MKKTTTQLLLEKYNTFAQRATIRDENAKRMIFRSFQRTIGQFLPADKSAKILDIACGEGALLTFLREMGYRNLAGFDLSDENVSICHELGLEFVVKFDALELENFSSGDKYDLIFALDILEHLPKDKVAGFLNQIYRLLNLGGYIIVQTPNMGALQGIFIRYNDLTHEFGLTEFSAKSLLLAAGWNINDIHIYPAWNATTFFGYLREWYLCLLHRLIFLVEGEQRPRIPTKNLLIVGRKSQ